MIVIETDAMILLEMVGKLTTIYIEPPHLTNNISIMILDHRWLIILQHW